MSVGFPVSSTETTSEKSNKKKRRRDDENDEIEGGDNDDNNEDNDNSDVKNDDDDLADGAIPDKKDKKDKLTKEEKRLAKKEKKEANQKLLSQIPTHDPDGMPYSKIQIRRMKRRVKHGLHPIPTEEEEREIKKRDEREMREEMELLYSGEGGGGGGDAGNSQENEDEDKGGGNDDNDKAEKESDGDGRNTDNEYEDEKENDENKPKGQMGQFQPPHKKSKRSKPVPPDYICMACNNKPPPNSNNLSATFEPHWIYDCPLKITKRGCNSISKHKRGLHDPPSRKVFVSGLPFDVSEGKVKRFFESNISNIIEGGDSSAGGYELVHCKLLKFEDSQRCKGQAFLTFDSDEGAKRALKLSGLVWQDFGEENEERGGKKSKKDKKKDEKKKPEEKGERKELKLKVTKVLNRFVTKNKKHSRN